MQKNVEINSMIHPYTVTFQRDIVNRRKRKEKKK